MPDNTRLQLEAAGKLLAALRGLVDAYGGDWPDWLNGELGAAEDAIAVAEKAGIREPVAVPESAR